MPEWVLIDFIPAVLSLISFLVFVPQCYLKNRS
ncbi:hypothetical protein DFP80_11417 [Marinomonas rhizomae]|uniref:Uncharacterized protein n=1 Tax=Marinomonas rhizomae TaxID=491948 RepID=A0A366J0E6_9GAMM|nr:hypothetical protein DFP80_11417 [Marinomonas rhizomae]